MIDPTNQPLDIEENRRWLIDHRTQRNLTWTEIAKAVDVPTGTISQFGSDKGYRGDESKVTEKVARYRQFVEDQAEMAQEAPDVPGYFETETSAQLAALLGWAHRGRVVVAAMGPGNSKTFTAKHYCTCYPNAFLVTMSPSTGKPATMMQEILAALGERGATGSPYRLATRIKDKLRSYTKPLLILDEAQHLLPASIDEARSWHDSMGVGLALFGNVGVLQKMEGGGRNEAFAQLYSRVSMRLVRALPLNGDVDALAKAWSVHDDETIDVLRKVVMTPGGMRNGTMALELAAILAGTGTPIGASHLHNAWAQLSSRAIAA